MSSQSSQYYCSVINVVCGVVSCGIYVVWLWDGAEGGLVMWNGFGGSVVIWDGVGNIVIWKVDVLFCVLYCVNNVDSVVCYVLCVCVVTVWDVFSWCRDKLLQSTSMYATNTQLSG